MARKEYSLVFALVRRRDCSKEKEEPEGALAFRLSPAHLEAFKKEFRRRKRASQARLYQENYACFYPQFIAKDRLLEDTVIGTAVRHSFENHSPVLLSAEVLKAKLHCWNNESLVLNTRGDRLTFSLKGGTLSSVPLTRAMWGNYKHSRMTKKKRERRFEELATTNIPLLLEMLESALTVFNKKGVETLPDLSRRNGEMWLPILKNKDATVRKRAFLAIGKIVTA